MVVPSAEVFLPLDELVDKTKELERLNAEKKKLEGEIKRVEANLIMPVSFQKHLKRSLTKKKLRAKSIKKCLKKSLKILSQWKICDSKSKPIFRLAFCIFVK